jgi:hypothetical protein
VPCYIQKFRVVSLLDSVQTYLFEPRFHINRFQLNLFALFFLILGSVIGIYFTSSKLLEIFATNQQNQNWEFSAETAAQYTVNGVSVDDTGAHPSGGQTGANEFSNAGFETDLTGWSASPKSFDDASFTGASGAVAAWPLDETNPSQSYARVVNPADSEGRNIVINGGFDSDTGWNKGPGATISGGVGVFTSVGSGQGFNQLSPLVLGNSYSVTFTVSGYSSGGVRVYIGSGAPGATRNADGTYTETLVASGDATLRVYATTAGTTLNVDNVSVTQLNIPASASFTGADLVTDGTFANGMNSWTQTSSPDTAEVTSGRLHVVESSAVYAGVFQTIPFTAGKRYRMTADYEVISGTLRIDNSIGFSTVTSANNGKYDAIFTANTESSKILFRSNNTAVEFYVDNVSVTEVSPLVGTNTNGVTVGSVANGHLTNAYTFDGSNDVVNIYSSDLNSVFNPDEGTLVAWAKVNGAGVWSDGSYREIIQLRTDASNYIGIFKNDVGTLAFYTAFGGITKARSTNTTTTDWFQVVITWSKSNDQVKAYLNGSQINSTLTGLGIWTGNLVSTTATIGTSTSSGSSPWAGAINDVRLYNRALSDAEIANMYSGATATRDTGIKYAGSASSKLVSYEGYNGAFVQSVNAGDSETYQLEAYAYTTSAEVTSSDLELYYNGAAITTAYAPTGIAGWYKLTGTITGANEARDYGVLVKANKTVYVDNFTLYKQGEYSVFNKNGFFSNQVIRWDSLCEGTFSGTTCTPDATYSGAAGLKYQFCTDDVGNTDGTSHGTACQTGNLWKYWDGDSWEAATNTITDTNTIDDLDLEAMNALPSNSHKISVKSIFTFEGTDVPILQNLSVGFTSDPLEPIVNATEVKLKRSITSTSFLDAESWTNGESPYFSWTEGQDDLNGSGVKGYCLYLGHDSSATPNQLGVSEENPNGTYLGTSPINTEGSSCRFIVPGSEVDFNSSANIAYRGSTWLTTSDSLYYLKVWVIDNAGNVRLSDPASFAFHFDNTLPKNVDYISSAGGNFSDINAMNFSWPTAGAVASSDANSQILGWQYQINSTNPDEWLGTTTHAELGINYIPLGDSIRTLTEEQDSYHKDSEGNPTTPIIVSGNNVVYFRTIDIAGNFSSDGTVRTGNLYFGGAAPTFGGTDRVTITPDYSETNSFALSWPAATATDGQVVAHYYYMLTPPPTTLATLQGNPSTYIDNGSSLGVAARALPGVNKGTNTVWVVAVDDMSNYSPSNFITGTFELDSSNPDNVGNLSISDASIKSQQQWNVTLTWTAPTYQGAGSLLYEIHRSTDGVNFSVVGSTMGLSYVDNTPSSLLYYYKVYTKDIANALSSGTNAVSIIPTGKWTTPPELISGPSVSSTSTRKVMISWSTTRTADSKISYGTSRGNYYSTEPSNSTHVTSHSIEITGLSPSTVYYYKAKWTDEDGNTGESEEQSFVTAPAPSVKDVRIKNVSLYSALIEFTSTNSAKVKIYYGKTTSFGGVKEIDTALSESTYLEVLEDLNDGTKYYYKINTIDSELNEYEGTILDFTTLPRPQISDVRIQQVANTAQSTVLVTWLSNTEISSIVSYYPVGKEDQIRDEVNIALEKGEHKMIIRGLLPSVEYVLVVKGRDRLGNEAISDSQKFTTATDTRPPLISNFYVEGTITSSENPTAQLIVSWNTDEPATSQIEFGEGANSVYSFKTQMDTNLTLNHLVIVSDLTPSKVYHLRALSEDAASNSRESYDIVTITQLHLRLLIVLLILLLLT